MQYLGKDPDPGLVPDPDGLEGLIQTKNNVIRSAENKAFLQTSWLIFRVKMFFNGLESSSSRQGQLTLPEFLNLSFNR
jgi:hypothetical protein